MARAAANVSRLELARNVSLLNNQFLHVHDMCAISAEELLFACGDAGLRAVSLRTGLWRYEAIKPTAIREVRGVAFDTHTDTLLLVVLTPTDVYQLVSLRRNASEWLEVQRLSIRTQYAYTPRISVCGSRVLLAVHGELSNTYYVS